MLLRVEDSVGGNIPAESGGRGQAGPPVLCLSTKSCALPSEALHLLKHFRYVFWCLPHPTAVKAGRVVYELLLGKVRSPLNNLQLPREPGRSVFVCARCARRISLCGDRETGTSLSIRGHSPSTEKGPDSVFRK